MKRNSFWSIIALMALMVMLALPGCDMGNNPEPELENDPDNGVMTLSTAKKVFTITEGVESVRIDKFLDIEALKAYIDKSDTGRRARLSEGEPDPYTFRISSINGKPVTRIAAGAFKPTKGDGSDDISRLAAVLNPDPEGPALPAVVIVLPETLDLDIEDLGGGLFEGVSGAIKVEIPTPVLERVLEKEIDKRVEAAAGQNGLTEAEKEEMKEDLRQALAEEPEGALAQDLVKELTETIQEAVGKGTGDGAGITIEQVAPDTANPDAPVIVPELPPIEVPPEPAAPVTPPVNTPPSNSTPTPPPIYTPPPIPDTTAPVLSGGPFSAPATFGGDTAEITFTTDEAGTYYYVALNSSTPKPTTAEIRAASSGSADSSGSPSSSTVSGSANVQAGAATVSVSGLTAKTAYIVYLIVVDARGNTSDILTIGPFTPAYTPGGQLAADLGKENIKGDDKAVTLIKDTTIISGTVTVPAEVTLDTGTYKLTLNNNATLSVDGALSVRKEFEMAGILSVGTSGEINVGSGGTIVFAETRTGGGKLEGTINIMDGGISKDLGSNANGGLWTVETGKTVFHAGAKGYSNGEAAGDLLIGTSTDPAITTYITLTSGSFTSRTGAVGGYILDGNATLNRTFGIADGQMLTIKENGKLTVYIQAHDMEEADGLWVLDSSGKIVGENGASIEVMPPNPPALLGFIFISRGALSNFYDSNGTKIETGNPHIAIGVGTYNWATNLGAGTDEEGWQYSSSN